MSQSAVFEWASDQVATISGLSGPQARGALRLALKEVGLEPTSLTPMQLKLVAERVLPRFLGKQGVQNPDAVIQALMACPANLGASANSAEVVFGRVVRPSS